jgi:preprotein translocase subunit SecG
MMMIKFRLIEHCLDKSIIIFVVVYIVIIIICEYINKIFNEPQEHFLENHIVMQSIYNHKQLFE